MIASDSYGVSSRPDAASHILSKKVSYKSLKAANPINSTAPGEKSLRIRRLAECEATLWHGSSRLKLLRGERVVCDVCIVVFEWEVILKDLHSLLVNFLIRVLLQTIKLRKAYCLLDK